MSAQFAASKYSRRSSLELRPRKEGEDILESFAAGHPEDAKIILQAIGREDVIAVAQQLGYIPFNLESVVARGQDGMPAAVRLYPLAAPVCRRRNDVECQPFPTIYWLTCPTLRRRVSHLEAAGWTEKMLEAVTNDEDMRKSLADQHHRYAQERWGMLDEGALAIVKENGWESALDTSRGVAGQRSSVAVKCLHAHYAHFLGTADNVLGQWVAQLLVTEGAGGTLGESVG